MKLTTTLRLAISTFLFFLILQNSFAANILWNGGSGYWSQANKWSSGTVPTAGDMVTIKDGFCIIPNNYQASAKGVFVGSGATFRINYNADLDLNDGNIDQIALENNGITYNFGEINIDNYQGNNPNTTVGIVNNNYFRNFGAGKIIIRNTNNHTLRNNIGDLFINQGTIDIDVAYDIWASCIQNLGRFQNRNSGVINIKNGYNGITSTNLATYFNNWGKIFVDDPGNIAIETNSAFTNFGTGIITCTEGPLYNLSDSEFTNHGVLYLSDIYVSQNLPALRNYGYIENFGDIFISEVYIGITNQVLTGSPAEIDNHGYLEIKYAANKSVKNLNVIENFEDGIIFCDHHLDDGDYINDGVIKNTFNGQDHTIDLTNNGIFNDKYGLLPSNITNNGIIIRPLMGPLRIGQPVFNAIQGAPNNNFTYGVWRDNIGGSICGSYINSSNIFLPNSNALGENEIHCHVELNSSGYSAFFDVIVLNNTFTGGAEIGNREASFPTNYTIYPNPSNGFINISTPELNVEKNNVLEIFDNKGVLVFSTKISGTNEQQYHLPENLISDNYILRIRDSQEIRHTESLVISK